MNFELKFGSEFNRFKHYFDDFPYSMCLIKKSDDLMIEYLNKKARLSLLNLKVPIALNTLIDKYELNKLNHLSNQTSGTFNMMIGSSTYHVECTQMIDFPNYFVCLLIDIKDYQTNVSELNRIIIEQTEMIVLEWHQGSSHYHYSPGAELFSFYQHNQLSRLNFLQKEDVHPDDWLMIQRVNESLMMGENQAKITIRLKDIQHSYLWCHLTFFLIRVNQQIEKMVITITNVDEAVKNRQSLEYRAEYDGLTGYYNFEKFKTLAKQLIKQYPDKKYAFCYMDIKNFKFLNDIYGYEEGDHILKYWADKLNLVSRDFECFARVSADHFVTLRTYDDIDDLVSRFHHSTHQLYKYQSSTNKKFPLEVSAGFYLLKDNDRHSIEDMLDRANIASKSAKQRPGSQYAFYDNHLRESVIARKELEAEMHMALYEEQFEVYLQPIVDIKNGYQVTAVEALVRWHHPIKGVISPNDFIPLFERNGFIVDLDLYMFQKVCQYIQKNQITDMIISVNVSRISAFQADFSKQYIAIKEKYQVPDGILELECTETTVVNNPRELNDIMDKLKGHGFLFAIDDFGSGYSSLNVLKEISTVDVLKLDRIFCTEDLNDSRNHAIVSSVIAMAKKLDMKVIAEGVESLQQRDILKALNCDYIQGYLFDRPMSIDDFDRKYRDLKN